jgi:hypothetical protein
MDTFVGGRPGRVWAIVLAVAVGVLGATTVARADDTGGDVGLTLNPILGGVHQSFNDIVHIAPIPIPLVEADYHVGPFEIDAQGLPPLASVRYFDETQGHTSTRLSIFEGVARVWDPLHRYSLGIGQTLYNQSTHYANSIEIAGTGETQFSRVTGADYQLGYSVPVWSGRFEGVVNYTPGMHGTQYTIYDLGFFRPRIDPERAEQIDTAVRYRRRIAARGELVLGLRYVNYTARYAERGGGLSDRNVGLLAVAGYLVHFGH